jgi:hypothetical protein
MSNDRIADQTEQDAPRIPSLQGDEPLIDPTPAELHARLMERWARRHEPIAVRWQNVPGVPGRYTVEFHDLTAGQAERLIRVSDRIRPINQAVRRLVARLRFTARTQKERRRGGKRSPYPEVVRRHYAERADALKQQGRTWPGISSKLELPQTTIYDWWREFFKKDELPNHTE